MSDDSYEFDYSIKGYMPFLRQKGMTCWAAAAAMMHGWSMQQTISIEEAIKHSRATTVDGIPYSTLLSTGRTLPYGEFGNFAYAMGMSSAIMRSFTVTNVLNLMMSRNSPLMVCVLQKNASISHFYVVTGIYSYGGDQPTVIVNDSNAENAGTELFFSDFYEMMENAAQKAIMDKQILYY